MCKHPRAGAFRLVPICLAALVACERVTDLSPEGKGNLVVECILSEDPVQTLRLSSTDIASASLENALISLTDESDGVLVGHFVHQEEDLWQLEYAAIPLHLYSLVVEVDEFDPVTAHTLMPEKLNIKYTVMGGVWVDNCLYHQSFNGFPDWECGTRFEIQSLPKGPVWVCGMNYDESSGRYVFARTIATSLASADLFNLTGEDYWNAYNPQSDKWFEDHYEDKYEGPAMAGVSNWWYHFPKEFRTSMYKYVVGCPLHDRLLRIPPIKENDDRTAPDPKKYFSIAGSFQGTTTFQPTPTDGYLLFISVSDEYDRYLKELLKEEARQSTMSDFASLFSRENIYGNIENGIGIFAAKTEQKTPWIKNNTSSGFAFEW